MAITLNHTIIPSSDKAAAAGFFARLVGLEVGPPAGPFAPVQVNGDLTLDFADHRSVVPGHWAFLVDEATFDHVLVAIGELGADFGSGPWNGWDGKLYDAAGGGRGVYVRAPGDGHSWEFFTSVG